MTAKSSLFLRTAAGLALCAGVLVSDAFAQQGQGRGRGDESGQPGERPQRRDRGEGGEGQRRFGGGGGMFGGGGMRGLFEAGVTSRQVDSMGKQLNLTSEQSAAVDALFEAYQDGNNDLMRQARETMESMRDDMRGAFRDGGPDPDLMRRMGEEFDKFRKSRKDLETSFFNDVKAVLTPEQTAQWPSVERTHRRESTINRGLMAGERVDLVRLTESLELPDDAEAQIRPILEQYATDLDRELVARNTAYDEGQAKMRDAFQSGNMADLDKVVEQGRAVSTRVRDVNRRYARQLEGVLPEESRQKFNEAFKRESFPLIYRPTLASRTVEAAPTLPDLDDTQRSAIQTIVDGYRRDSASINKELETAWEAREASFRPQDMMGGGRGGFGRGGMLGDDERSQELRDRRRTLEETTVEKIKAVLRPEQIEQLPTRESQRGRGPGAGEGDPEGDDAPRARRRPAGDAPERDTPRRPGPTR